MKLCVFLAFVFLSLGAFAKEPLSLSRSKMLTLSTEEMVFASKLSDENRYRFCYSFSVKERTRAMLSFDSSVPPNERVENLFTALYDHLEAKVQTRKTFEQGQMMKK